MNLIDYVHWRGDLSFGERPFNDNDALILTQLPYHDWGSALDNGPLTIAQLWDLIKNDKDLRPGFYDPLFHSLMKEMAASRRFRNLPVSDYRKETLIEKQQQFAALTIRLKRNVYYVSFKGTDTSLVGWKEDFNMVFTYPIPSQESSLRYLQDWVSRHPFSHFYVGGHSKGGNMAMYAAMMLGKPKKIIRVYNLDGPGFPKEVLSSPAYLSIKDKFINFLPESSVIGRTLENNSPLVIVKPSSSEMRKQHDVFFWMLNVDRPYEVPAFSSYSEFFAKSLEQWSQQLSEEQKRESINTIYSTFVEMNITTIDEVFSRKFAVAKTLYNKYGKLDEKTKNIMNTVIRSLVQISTRNILDSFRKDTANENTGNQ